MQWVQRHSFGEMCRQPNSRRQITWCVQRPKVVTEQWQKILDIQKAGEVVTSTIKKVNRGGVVIDVVGIAGGAQCH